MLSTQFTIAYHFSRMEITALAPTRTRRQQVHLTTNATWTKEEDDLLTQIASSSDQLSWSTIAKYFPNKTAPQLAGRWEKVLNPNLIKGSWTREEDEVIVEYVTLNGDKDWAKLAQLLKGRTGKQCRERFKNHLDPTVVKNSWTDAEDKLLIDLHSKYGNAWTKISSFFEGRTDKCIKNRWNSTLKKRLERQEKGEPLVLKRGRKPKGYYETLPKPDIADSTSSCYVASDCSSPLRPHHPFSIIELIPLTETFPILKHINAKREEREMMTLEQNRSTLLKLLNAALA